MKYSKGINLTAGVDNTIFTVPTGYDAVVTYLFISNVGGSTHSVDAEWQDGTTIQFLGGKSISAGDYIAFGGPEGAFLVMTEGDSIVITPEAASSFCSIISFDLYPMASRLNV